jgi:hypothetical protein
MTEEPTPAEILVTVATFLRETAVPQLAGHASFTARVAANAVDLVRREIEMRPVSDQQELGRLEALLGRPGTLDELNAELAQAIRSDRLATDAPALLDHLWKTTLEKLAIDQPSYASYRAALAQNAGTPG